MANKELMAQLDQITNQFQQQFGALPVNDLNWKPSSGSWSIAQVMDHLITINRSYFPIIDQVKKGDYKLPFITRIPFMPSFFGSMILKSVNPNRKMKTKTFPIWEPSASHIDKGIVQRFMDHQNELKQAISDSEYLVDKEVIISSPANRNIVYKLGKAFEIIVTHEMRHYNQAAEVLDLLNTSKK